MTLGEWLNRVILEDDGGPAAGPEPELHVVPEAYVAPEPPHVFEAPRPRLVAETAVPRPDELARIAHALDRLTDRIEASETRTGLAVSGVEHSVRQAVARIEAAERESMAVAARFETAVDHVGGEQARLAERLRRFETDTAGPRSTEALRAIEQSVSRMAGQIYESEGRAREGASALEARLARIEARAGADPAQLMDEVVQRLGERLARAESQTVDALEGLRRSMAALDGRLRTVEGGRSVQDRRFEALAQTLTEQLEDARAQVAERLKAVDAGRIDRRFAELAAEVQTAEQRSARAIQEMGRQVLTMADTLNRRLQTSEDRNAEAIAQVGGEMARVAEAMEARLGRAEQSHAEALGRLTAELGGISDRLSDRLLVSERRAAEAIDDVGEQVGRVSERMAQSQERSAQDLADRIRESEERTARLLEESCTRLEQRLGEPPVVLPEPPPPPAAAFGPELFSRAEEAEEEDLDLTEPAPAALAAAFSAAPPPVAAFAPERFESSPFEAGQYEAGHYESGRFEAADAFVPIPEPEEDLFGLDQPEPPADAEVGSALSTREVIEQARAAARAAAPAEKKPERLQVKAKASWRSNGKHGVMGGGLFGLRPKRAPSSTLQTAIMVAGGAAFLSVGAAGVVLMQGPAAHPPAEVAQVGDVQASGGQAGAGAADDAEAPRAAVALAPHAVEPVTPAPAAVPAEFADSPRPPAQLADALLTAYASAVKGVEAGEPGALAKLRAIAEAGHPPAQFYLGKLYETGDHGVKQSLSEARRWTQRAAEGGDAAAMHNLALFNFRGEGGAQDLAVAARWFRAAAEQGIVDSQYNLGLLYQSGSGVEADPVQAYAWFSIAGAGGDAQARANARETAARLTPQQRAAGQQMISAYAARAGVQAQAPAAPRRYAAGGR
jgi:localization factor PodJL